MSAHIVVETVGQRLKNSRFERNNQSECIGCVYRNQYAVGVHWLQQHRQIKQSMCTD